MIHWRKWTDLTGPKRAMGLGFKDLSDYNLSLLSKTAWRVQHNPEALWDEVLKGLYFLDGNFLEAKKGGRASWCWSSIYEGKELLLKGAIWKIVDGKEVNIWGDPWVFGCQENRLHEIECGEMVVNRKVQALIDRGREKWKIEEIQFNIAYEELRAIALIPILPTERPYRLI